MSNVGRYLRRWLPLLALCAALTFASAAGSTLAEDVPPEEPPPEVPAFSVTWSDQTRLLVQSPSADDVARTTGIGLVVVGRRRWPGKLALDAPARVGLQPSAPQGTWIGDGGVSSFTDSKQAPLAFAQGRIKVAARNAYPAQARSCAPGQHTAVWGLSLTGLRSRWDEIELPLFVDRGKTGAWRLTLCMPAAVSRLPGRFLSLGLSLRNVVSGPAGAGRYTWSARVTPFSATRAALEPVRAYELRSTTLMPHTLTIAGRYDPATGTAELSGRVAAAGGVRAGVHIFFGGFSDPNLSDFRLLGSTPTTKSGAFSFRVPIANGTTFLAAVDARATRCTGRSSAPGGCLSETTAPPPSVWARIEPEG